MNIKRLLCLLLGALICAGAAGLAACGGPSPTEQRGEVDAKDVYDGKDGVLYWPEEQYLPVFRVDAADRLDYLDLTEYSNGVALLITSLKAIVNREEVRIYTKDRELDWRDWIFEMGYSQDDLVVHDNPYALLEKYVSGTENIIICDTKQEDTVNLASTLAAVTPALIATPEVYDKLRSLGYSFRVIADFRDQFASPLAVYEYLYDTFWKTGLVNRRVMFGTSPGIPGALREYAIASGGACVYLNVDVQEQKELFQKYCDLMPAGNAAYAGWFWGESNSVEFLAKNNIVVWSADYLSNLILLSSREEDRVAIDRREGSKPDLENKIYLMFGVTDGDNLGSYMSQGMATLYDYVQEKNRYNQAFPISWSASPMAYDVMPTVLRYYYDSADPDLMDFFTAESGYGYTYTGSWSSEKALVKFFDYTNLAMKRADMNVINTWYEAGTNWIHEMTEHQKDLFTSRLTNCVGFFDNCNKIATELRNGMLLSTFTEPYSSSVRYTGDNFPLYRIMVDDAYGEFLAGGKTEPQFVSILGYCWDYETMYENMYETYRYCQTTYGKEVEFVTISQLVDLMTQYETEKAAA